MAARPRSRWFDSGSLLLDSRIALLAGFGGLLALLIFSSLDAVRVLSQVRSRNEEIRREFLDRARRLEHIRSAVYLSGTYIRDYLLEPDAVTAEKNRAGLDATRTQIESELAAYEQLLGPADRAPLRTLRTRLENYWVSLRPALAWNAFERRGQGYQFLRDEVFPRRASMLDIAGRIGEVNERELTAGDQRVAELFAGFRNRLLTMLGITVLLGILQSTVSIRRILALERAADRHLAEVSAARGQFKDLSARLVEVQENDRKQVSRELHDAVGQPLSAVLIEIRNALPLLPEGAGELAANLERIRRQVETSVGLVRNIALLLRPSMLDDLGLGAALEWQARDVARRTGMVVNVDCEELPEQLGDDYKTCIFRVVQEALNNVSKHAGAQTVAITARQQGGQLVLTIRDDGAGFDCGRQKGLGLLGMHERVQNLNGTLQIDSEPGHGTLLRCVFPLPARDQRRAS